MDTMRPSPSSVVPRKSKFARTVAKLLHLRAAASGVAPFDSVKNLIETQEKVNHDDDKNGCNKNGEVEKDLVFEALLAKVFATISSVKSAYAQLQHAQSPYDAEGIEAADQLVVTELKNLSELKHCFVKKQSDSSPEIGILSAEVLELKSHSKVYEIMGKKLESQLRLKESEIMYLKEKLEESNRQNWLIEKNNKFDQSGKLMLLSALDNFHQSGLSPAHFIKILRLAVKSIRSFVKVMIDEMKSACWDLDDAANSIESNVVYWREDDKCFVFESFVCRKMFDAFQLPNFSLPTETLQEGQTHQQRQFFKRFMELKSLKAKEYISQKPKSTFAKFCYVKYLQLIHPQMERSFFGSLSQRNGLVNSGLFPGTSFFASFAEMAKWVWLLHCLAFSIEPVATIFQVQKGCRFSVVYMECVAEDAPEAEPLVAFTVVPGFRIGKTVIQCQVYLSQIKTEVKH